jgi:hypothetical protein
LSVGILMRWLRQRGIRRGCEQVVVDRVLNAVEGVVRQDIISAPVRKMLLS